MPFNGIFSEMNNKNKFIRNAVIVLILIFIIPVSVLITGFCVAPQFSDTYYGELGAMYDKLIFAKGKKIVIIGTSSVAFGVDSALIENELKAAGEEYTVCNFGLYGAIGTKAMFDLSEKHIKEGDIVIFAPEFSKQTLSLYFSAKEILRSADGNFGILGGIAKENVAETVGNFTAFAAEKLKYAHEGGIKTEGVYARASFDENCDMKNAERTGNIMQEGYIPDQLITLSGELFPESFINYINDYASVVRRKGGKTYFTYPPMNRLALTDCSETTLEKFYNFISAKLDYKVISNAEKYIMDAEWFYDTNYHLNSAGMTVRSINLLEDIKNELGVFTHTQAQMPEKPPLQIPEKPSEDKGDDSDADCFEYSDDGKGGLIVAALKESGKTRDRLTVPYSYGGKKITSLAVGVFAGDEVLKEVVIQDNIRYLRDGSFSGCKKLEKIILRHTSPSQVGVSYGLLENTAASVFIRKSAFSAFSTDYTWGWYADRMVSYEV